MSRNDPRTIGLTPQARQAELNGSHRSQIASLQRRGGGSTITIPSFGSATGDVVGLIPGTLSINSAATPSVARWGIGTTAHATTALTIQSAAMGNVVVADEAHGGVEQFNGGAYADNGGLRWNIYHGDSTNPVEIEQATFKVSRYEEYNAARGNATSTGAGATMHAAIQGINVADDSTAMPTGVVGCAINSTAGTHVGTTNNLDACGVAAFAKILSGGGGLAVGAHNEVQQFSTVARATYATEQHVNNQTGVDGVFDPVTLSSMAGTWYILNGRAGGSAIDFGNVTTYKWNVGLSFKSSNGGPVSDSSIHDAGTATISYHCLGTHTSAFVAGSGAGNFMLGTVSPTVAAKMTVQGTSDERTLVVRTFSGQTQPAFQIRRGSDDASLFLIDAGGGFTMRSAANMTFSTTTGTKIGTGATELIGLWGVTPVVQRSALTQTYATVSRTHSAMTMSSLTDNSGGSANATIQAMPDPTDTPATADALRDDIVANLLPAIRNNFADLVASFATLRADVVNVKNFVNALADDSQAIGVAT